MIWEKPITISFYQEYGTSINQLLACIHHPEPVLTSNSSSIVSVCYCWLHRASDQHRACCWLPSVTKNLIHQPLTKKITWSTNHEPSLTHLQNPQNQPITVMVTHGDSPILGTTAPPTHPTRSLRRNGTRWTNCSISARSRAASACPWDPVD